MDIYAEILRAFQSEDRIMLATIISTAGSTPASALSKMLVKQGGIVSVGTVGGGCMEGDVLLHANRLHQTGKAEILTFHLNEDDIEHGLICGGSLDVLIEPITHEQCSLLNQILSMRKEGDDGVLVRSINEQDGIRWLHLVRWNNGIMEQWNDLEPMKEYSNNPGFRASVEKAYRRNETVRLKLEKTMLVFEPIMGSPSLVIFGGGHVSKYVSKAASMIGFHVTIIDDREKFANSQRFPEAVQTIAMDFLEAVGNINIRSSTYVVIVTRGHRYDEEILEQVLRTPARYIGMIGSKRKVLTTYEHLIEKGVTADEFKRVHAPMGIDIGAVTAEEIAISIVSEMIAVRRNIQHPLKHKADAMKSLIGNLLHKTIA